jgi:hypothetical protein
MNILEVLFLLKKIMNFNYIMQTLLIIKQFMEEEYIFNLIIH